MGYNLDIYTFHKLGLSILGNVNIISDNYLDYIIDEYFESVIKYDKSKFIKSLFFTDKNINKVYMTKEYYQEVTENDYDNNGYNAYIFKRMQKYK